MQYKYRLIHSYYKNKPLAKTNFNQVKKKWDAAELSEDEDGYSIVLFQTYEYSEAMRVLHEVFQKGLWCGIEKS